MTDNKEKEEELKRIIRDAFMLYGIPVDNPTEMQQNIIYLQKLRVGSETMKKNIIKIIIGTLIPAMLFIFFSSFTAFGDAIKKLLD